MRRDLRPLAARGSGIVTRARESRSSGGVTSPRRARSMCSTSHGSTSTTSRAPRTARKMDAAACFHRACPARGFAREQVELRPAEPHGEPDPRGRRLPAARARLHASRGPRVSSASSLSAEERRRPIPARARSTGGGYGRRRPRGDAGSAPRPTHERARGRTRSACLTSDSSSGPG